MGWKALAVWLLKNVAPVVTQDAAKALAQAKRKKAR